MVSSIVKGKMNIVNKNGDVQTVYPETSGDKVLIDRSSNTSVIPNDVSNLQHIINKMGSLALKSKITTSDFANNVITTDVNVTTNGKIADARVIKTLNDRITTIEDSDFIKTETIQLYKPFSTEYFSRGQFEYELTDNNGFSMDIDSSVANIITNDNTYTLNFLDYTFPDKIYGMTITNNNIETHLNMYINITEFINKNMSIRICILKSGNMYSSGYLNTIINHNNSIPCVITNKTYYYNKSSDALNIDLHEDSNCYYYEINLNDITVSFESDAYYLKFVISHYNNGKNLIVGNIFMNIEYLEDVYISKNLHEVLPYYYTKSQSDNNYYTKSQVNGINSLTNYYTKSQSDNNYYTKSQIDSDYYTKSQVNSINSLTNYYTKSQVNGINSLTNYYTKSQSDKYYYTKSQIDDALPAGYKKLALNTPIYGIRINTTQSGDPVNISYNNKIKIEDVSTKYCTKLKFYCGTIPYEGYPTDTPSYFLSTNVLFNDDTIFTHYGSISLNITSLFNTNSTVNINIKRNYGLNIKNILEISIFGVYNSHNFKIKSFPIYDYDNNNFKFNTIDIKNYINSIGVFYEYNNPECYIYSTNSGFIKYVDQDGNMSGSGRPNSNFTLFDGFNSILLKIEFTYNQKPTISENVNNSYYTDQMNNLPNCNFDVDIYSYNNDTNNTIIANVVSPNKYITCWGDGFANTGNNSWLNELQKLTYMSIYSNDGCDDSATICAIQGADAMVLNNITIPASDQVYIASRLTDTGITTVSGKKVTPAMYNTNINPCKINNIYCNLYWTGSGDNEGWIIKRANPSDEDVIIDRPSIIETNLDMNYNSPYLMIISMGEKIDQNGSHSEYTNLDELVNQHKMIIQHANAEHYIIIGYSTGSAVSQSEYETRMKKEFGRYFISLREYLSTAIYEDNEIVSCYGIADQDADISMDYKSGSNEFTVKEEIERGIVPHPLFVIKTIEYTLYNNETIITKIPGYTDGTNTVIANLIYKRCKELNIF